MQELLTNTQTAFQYKSTKDLKLAKTIYGVMHKYPDLVLLLSGLGLTAVKWKLPFANYLVYNTFYRVFCGGKDLDDCETVIQNLFDHDVQTVLDYGAEAKDSEQEYEAVTEEFLRAIEFASKKDAVPLISMKMTAIADFELLEKYSKAESVKSEEDLHAWKLVRNRFSRICEAAYNNNMSVFVDAEESWIQGALDILVLEMMEKYNTTTSTVYNTYQMYLNSSYNRLTSHYKELNDKGIVLGAKLVRGAYMEKESLRAKKLNIEDPIYPSKGATDDAYNEAIIFCFNNRDYLSFCCATHNRESCIHLLELIKLHKVENHENITFCQLYGMSDNLTFNLATQGVKSMKYLPYGSVNDTFPYLVRRAQENTSITNDASREYLMISEELERRKKHARS